MKFGESKPESKGALVAIVAGAPKPSPMSEDLSEDEPESEEGPADMSFRAVAKAFGIPPERQAAAKSALHQYIRMCAESSEPEDEDY